MFFYMTQRGRKTAFIIYAFHNRTMPLSKKNRYLPLKNCLASGPRPPHRPTPLHPETGFLDVSDDSKQFFFWMSGLETNLTE